MTVQVHPIERKVLCDPLCNLDHVFVIDDEVNSRAQTITDCDALLIALVSGVLIQLWCNSRLDHRTKSRRAKSIRESDRSKIVNYWIKHLCAQGVKRVVRFRI
jgi:hypothetical protein